MRDDKLKEVNSNHISQLAASIVGAGDNLGNHTATEDLKMGAFDITLDALSTVDGVDISARDHAKYTDGEAVTAMGVKGAGNPLHHDIAVIRTNLNQLATRNHTDLQNKNTEANIQHLTAAEKAKLHDDVITTNAHADARIAAANHDVLQNPNGNAEEQHLTSAQQGALHAIYTLEQHNNTKHSTNYHTEAHGTGVVTVHSDVTHAGSGLIITDAERTDLGLQATAAEALTHVNATGLSLSATKTITTADEATIHTFGRQQLGKGGDEAAYATFGFRGMALNEYVIRANSAHTETRINVGQGAGSKIRMGVNEGNAITISDGQSIQLGSGAVVQTFDNGTVATNSATRVPTQQAVKTYVDAEVAAVGINDIQLIAVILANGATESYWTSTPIAQIEAVDQNAEVIFTGHAPSNMTAMVNPNLIIGFYGAAADEWVITTRVHAATHGEAQGNNLHNGAETLTAGAGATLYLKTIALVGTISARDIVGVRIIKTSSDAQILYLNLVCWIERV